MYAVGRNVIVVGLALLATPLNGQSKTSVKVATDAVRNATADPIAVQFRNVRAQGAVICGEYNAKNSYGAYVGFDNFVFEPARNEGFLMKSMARISRSGVIESPEGIIKALRGAGAGLDAKASRQQMDKVTSDAAAMLLRCA
ncbi:hypothetical protein [Blastomonas sp. AAP53]|uniref:hypothetical protein n=1 Tax=Blastomonas sp. AAP53 TaxID=1248760 RepID=UPI0012670EC8|nr:hypothetical protein [Blastomonas sp. AAP53]